MSSKDQFWKKLSETMNDPNVRKDYDEVSTFIEHYWPDKYRHVSSNVCETLFFENEQDINRPHDTLKCQLCDSMAVGSSVLYITVSDLYFYKRYKQYEDKISNAIQRDMVHGRFNLLISHGKAPLPTFRSFCFWVVLGAQLIPFIQPDDTEPLVVETRNLNEVFHKLSGIEFLDTELPQEGGLLMFLLSRNILILPNIETSNKFLIYMKNPLRISAWDFIEKRHLRKLRAIEKELTLEP